MTTKSGIRCSRGWTDDLIVHEVELPNGRKIERLTMEGADEFVEAVGIDFISTNLTTTNDNEMFVMSIIMRTVIKNASREKIAACFPESELRLFVEYMRDELDRLSKESNWLRSGELLLRYDLLMYIVASFTRHQSFVKIFYSNGMEAVAKFYASRKQKNETPNYRVAHWIINLVDNTLSVLTQQEGLKHEKVFGTMEKAGLLGQFFRCVSVDAEYSAHALECLQMCQQLVKKKLKPGTPTGDILDAVLAGKDGPINEKAKSALARLQSLAQLSNYGSECVTNDIKACGHCEKPETHGNLMKCQRCKAIYYCSKECQVADWKIHKRTCKAISGGIVSRSKLETSRSTVDAFIESNFFDIAKEIYKKTQEFNVSKKELILEIDFFGDAPALRNEFNVWLTSGFLEGSSVADVPDWFRTYVDKKTIARLLKRQHEEWTCADLFSVCHGSNGIVTVSRLRMPLTEAGYSYLSDEVVEAIATEDYDRMLACMGQALTDDYYREKKA
jgi:hypothetical protein